MAPRALAIVTILALTGCSSLLAIHDPVAGDAARDGIADTSADSPGDTSTIEESPLLLSEVVLSPTESEMIEIVNTADHPIDLSTYYVSDAGDYFRLPAGAPSLDPNDFIARFPAGTTIPAGGVVTIAIATTAEFTTSYGIAPTASIASGTMVVVASGGAPNLTNGGELVVLFRWDGLGDLVRDADLVLVGSPSPANGLIDKSGLQQDGGDLDVAPSAYQVDARTITIQAGTPPSDTSTKRIALEVGHETHAGNGNGIAGQDETTEDTAMTWDGAVFGVATPGQVPAALLP